VDVDVNANANANVSIFLLVMAIVVWSFSVLGVKWSLEAYSPLWSNSIRFFLSGMIVLPFLLWKRSYRRSLGELYAPLWPAIYLLLYLLLQTFALKQTTVAKNTFITSFYAFFTPMIGFIFYGKRYHRLLIPIILLALFGIALLCDLDFYSINVGDGWALVASIFAALQIIAIDKYGKDFDSSVEFNGLQCLYLGSALPLMALILEGPVSIAPLLDLSSIIRPGPLSGLVINSLFAGVIAFSIQVKVQKQISPDVVALMCLLISPLTSLLAYILMGERMSPLAMIGGGVVLLAAVLVLKFGGEVTSN
jgi:drug/metabolite transporter (DMT)-like permease